MTVNSSNARIFGSDSDSINLAPLGTTPPTTLDGALDSAFEDVGWLNEDGITETATGSKTAIRGHQGGNVVRSIMEESGTTVGFTALESKAQTKSLRYDEKNATVDGGVRTATRGAGQKVSARAAVIDIFDADDVTVKERLVIERFEIVPDGDRVFVSSDISGFPFMGEIVGDYISIESTSESLLGEVWDLTISGTPTGGTYTLTLNGSATAPIAYGASTNTIASALNALSGVTGITGITATGSGPIVITFPTAVSLSANGSALTGGTDSDATVALP
ncbi:hypothetical protein [Cryobacterium sp. Y62]|uniref:phage tail tube protein n=1 Tax=Cryobacterium sp. Y62 TaxID=2048284 RepID=UPI000CE44007|nr:hypothetical protein [Cryobacterium sp. Y62]